MEKTETKNLIFLNWIIFFFVGCVMCWIASEHLPIDGKYNQRINALILFLNATISFFMSCFVSFAKSKIVVIKREAKIFNSCIKYYENNIEVNKIQFTDDVTHNAEIINSAEEWVNERKAVKEKLIRRIK